MNRECENITALPTNGPEVSVILVNYNGKKWLENCLRSLRRTRDVSFDIILIDNASVDGSLDWLREHAPDIQVLSQDVNIGFGRANAIGVSEARGSYVAFLNTDTAVDPDWLSALLHGLREDESIGAVTSLMTSMDHPEMINAAGGGMTWTGYSYRRYCNWFIDDYAALHGDSCADVFFASGAAMLMKKETFLEVGGFDDAMFMYHEDVDLGWRLWLAGVRVAVCPASRVRHADTGFEQAAEAMSFSEVMGARHNVRTLLKCFEWRQALIALFYIAMMYAYKKRFGLLFKVALWNLYKGPSTMAERRRIQKGRVRCDRELLDRSRIDPYAAFPSPLYRFKPDVPPEGLLMSHHLYPGEDSALGRLGEGWSAKVETDGKPCRMMADAAHCVMLARPGQKGALHIHFKGLNVHGTTTLYLHCNEQFLKTDIRDGQWHEMQINVNVPESGLLQIRMGLQEQHTVRSIHRTHLSVKCIVFEPDESVEVKTRPVTTAVVIPHMNKGGPIAEVIRALERQTVLPTEVIIVDDGSRVQPLEELKEVVSKPWKIPVQLICQAHAGPSVARNRGVDAASSDIVLFIGDDICPGECWLEHHLRTHEELGPGHAVCGYTVWDDDRMRVSPLLNYVNEHGEQFGYAYFTQRGALPFTCFYTSNISIARDLLEIYRFDPWFTDACWEDCELGYRLCCAGVRIIYEERASARHYHPMNATAFYRRQQKAGRLYATMVRERWPRLQAHFYNPSERMLERLKRFEWLIEVGVKTICLVDRFNIPLPKAVYRYSLALVYCLSMRE